MSVSFLPWETFTASFFLSPYSREWTPSYRLYAALFSTVVLIMLTYSLVTSFAGVEIYVSRSSNTLYREFILTPNPSNVDLIVMKNTSASQLFNLIIGMVVLLEYAIIVACGFKIWLHLRRHFQTVPSGSSRYLQRQVNYVLLVQALLPIVGLMLPVCIDVFGSQFKVAIAAMPFIFQFATLSVMIANPLFTILLIESYRRQILGCCSISLRTTSTTSIRAVDINLSPSIVVMSFRSVRGSVPFSP